MVLKECIIRSNNLEKLFKALMTIQPTYVESELAFYGLDCFVTKIRNRLQDETLDAVMLLRSYFKL